MLRLIRVEVSRLLARRMVWALALLLLGGMLVANGVRFARASSHTPAGATSYGPSRVEVGPPARVQPDPSFGEEGSEQEEFFQHAPVERDRRYFMRESADEVKAVGILVAVLGYLVGTSFGGAEWAAGTMQALLFWEPRRTRVMLAKLAALALVLVVASALAQLFQLGLSAVTAELRGTFAGASVGFYENLLETAGRTTLLAAFTALLAFGVAGLTRNTAAALGIGFVYFAIVENVLRGLRPGWSRYLVTSQFAAWVEGEIALESRVVRSSSGAFVDVAQYVLHMGRAGLTMVIYLALVVGAMTLTFVRRDVT